MKSQLHEVTQLITSAAVHGQYLIGDISQMSSRLLIIQMSSKTPWALNYRNQWHRSVRPLIPLNILFGNHFSSLNQLTYL